MKKLINKSISTRQTWRGLFNCSPAASLHLARSKLVDSENSERPKLNERWPWPTGHRVLVLFMSSILIVVFLDVYRHFINQSTSARLELDDFLINAPTSRLLLIAAVIRVVKELEERQHEQQGKLSSL